MFGIEVLEIVIGLVFVYLLLSLLATTLNELVMQWLYSRGKNLHIALQTMLDDETDVLCKHFFNHALIQKLKKRGTEGFPSYISQAYFAKVLIELLSSHGPLTMDAIRAGVQQLPAGQTRQVLSAFVRDAEGSLEQFRQDLGLWYQEMMNQATGWYKTKVQYVLFGIGLLLSILFNADTFQVAQKLSIDSEARRRIIEQAYTYIEREEARSADSTQVRATADSLERQVRQLIDEELMMASTALGIGWAQEPAIDLAHVGGWRYVLQRFLGWIVTAFAITLGAPFWFDLLKKIMNIRAAARKPDEKALSKKE